MVGIHNSFATSLGYYRTQANRASKNISIAEPENLFRVKRHKPNRYEITLYTGHHFQVVFDKNADDPNLVTAKVEVFSREGDQLDSFSYNLVLEPKESRSTYGKIEGLNLTVIEVFKAYLAEDSIDAYQVREVAKEKDKRFIFNGDDWLQVGFNPKEGKGLPETLAKTEGREVAARCIIHVILKKQAGTSGLNLPSYFVRPPDADTPGPEAEDKSKANLRTSQSIIRATPPGAGPFIGGRKGKRYGQKPAAKNTPETNS